MIVNHNMAIILALSSQGIFFTLNLNLGCLVTTNILSVFQLISIEFSVFNDKLSSCI